MVRSMQPVALWSLTGNQFLRYYKTNLVLLRKTRPRWDMSLFTNFRPLSVFLLLQIIADGHRKKRTTATRICLSNFFESFIGHQKLSCTHSFGSLGSYTFFMSPLAHTSLTLLYAAVHSWHPSVAATKLRKPYVAGCVEHVLPSMMETVSPIDSFLSPGN